MAKINETILTSLRNILGADNVLSDEMLVSINIPQFKSDQVFKILKETFGYHILIDLFAIDCSLILGPREFQHSYDMEIVYLLLNPVNHTRLKVIVPYDREQQLWSIHKIYENATWYELELYDLFGIDLKFGPPKRRPFCGVNFMGHPLLKKAMNQKIHEYSDEDDPLPKRKLVDLLEDLGQKVGHVPSNPFMRGSTRVWLDISDNQIHQSVYDFGMSHRGIEKSLEHIHPIKGLSVIEKISPYSSVTYTTLWSMAWEELANIKVPLRAQALRMAFLELERIFNHLCALSALFWDAQMPYEYRECLDAKEILLSIFVKYDGKRIFFAPIKIGGVKQDTPSGWSSFCLSQMDKIEKIVNRLKARLIKLPEWLELSTIANLSLERALSLGVFGPCAKSIGINYDLRKISPYLLYQDVDFSVPLGVEGSCYDRFIVRLIEIEESKNILFQVLENLPMDNIQALDDRCNWDLLGREDGTLNVDVFKERISKFNISHNKFIYKSIEGPEGESGISLIPDSNGFAYRVKIRSPSFSNLQVFDQISRGLEWREVNFVLSSLWPNMMEIDR